MEKNIPVSSFSEDEQITIWEYVLGLSIRTRGNSTIESFCSPFRVDKKPNCKLTLGSNVWWFTDHAYNHLPEYRGKTCIHGLLAVKNFDSWNSAISFAQTLVGKKQLTFDNFRTTVQSSTKKHISSPSPIYTDLKNKHISFLKKHGISQSILENCKFNAISGAVGIKDFVEEGEMAFCWKVQSQTEGIITGIENCFYFPERDKDKRYRKYGENMYAYNWGSSSDVLFVGKGPKCLLQFASIGENIYVSGETSIPKDWSIWDKFRVIAHVKDDDGAGRTAAQSILNEAKVRRSPSKHMFVYPQISFGMDFDDMIVSKGDEGVATFQNYVNKLKAFYATI